MLKRIQSFFNAHIETAALSGQRDEHALRLATAALLFEVTRADFEIHQAERQAIEKSVRKAFSLNDRETRELVELAEREVEEAVSLYQFTGLINQHFSPREKVRVLEMLWHVAFVDGHLDRYEEGLVRKVAELIHVPHREYIQARHRVEATFKD